MHIAKMTHKVIAVTAIVCLLSACNAKTNDNVNTSEPRNPTGANVTADPVANGPKPDAAPSPSTPAGEPAAVGKDTVNQGQKSHKQPAPVKMLYRMNKAYRLVPIVKSAAPEKVVLLTFDDGPKEDAMLTSMLDTLDKHKAKAIFFVNGYRVKKHPELLKKIADRGQTIGNHSWDHINLKKETAASVEKQIGDVQTIVKETTGQTPVFFRPPFGSGGETVKKIVREHGMLYMTWSNGSLDWDSSTKDKPELVISNVIEQLHPGANILMHELPWTDQALDTLLTRLEEKGYGFIDPASIDLELEPGSAK